MFRAAFILAVLAIASPGWAVDPDYCDKPNEARELILGGLREHGIVSDNLDGRAARYCRFLEKEARDRLLAYFTENGWHEEGEDPGEGHWVARLDAASGTEVIMLRHCIDKVDSYQGILICAGID
jgi:hypothetical protein